MIDVNLEGQLRVEDETQILQSPPRVYDVARQLQTGAAAAVLVDLLTLRVGGRVLVLPQRVVVGPGFVEVHELVLAGANTEACLAAQAFVILLVNVL